MRYNEIKINDQLTQEKVEKEVKRNNRLNKYNTHLLNKKI